MYDLISRANTGKTLLSNEIPIKGDKYGTPSLWYITFPIHELEIMEKVLLVRSFRFLQFMIEIHVS